MDEEYTWTGRTPTLTRRARFTAIAHLPQSLPLLLLAAQVIVKIPVVSSLLGLLGRHSGNMFLMHNQLYSFYFLGFFYSFRHWALILLVLTAVSLAVSVLMEYLKKLTHYNVLTAHLEGRAS